MVVLYDKDECPFCWKIRLALVEKGVVFTQHRVDTDNKPPALLALNPLGKVPVLGIDDLVLTESTLVMHYLEDRYPEPSLLPATPEQRHRARWLNHYADTVIGPRIRDGIFEQRAKPPAQWDRERIGKAREGWQQCLQELSAQCDGGEFFVGEFSMADCALVPRFGLALAYQLGGLDDYPRLSSWFERCRQRPSYALTAAQICLA